MKQKYIDEKVGVWFVWGQYANGNVDIGNGTEDIFTYIPKDKADRLCELQAKFREELYKITDTL